MLHLMINNKSSTSVGSRYIFAMQTQCHGDNEATYRRACIHVNGWRVLIGYFDYI